MQVRAAKDLLNWLVPELDKKAGVDLSTIRRIKGGDGLL
jgi:hypothetical protein